MSTDDGFAKKVTSLNPAAPQAYDEGFRAGYAAGCADVIDWMSARLPVEWPFGKSPIVEAREHFNLTERGLSDE